MSRVPPRPSANTGLHPSPLHLNYICDRICEREVKDAKNDILRISEREFNFKYIDRFAIFVALKLTRLLQLEVEKSLKSIFLEGQENGLESSNFVFLYKKNLSLNYKYELISQI